MTKKSTKSLSSPAPESSSLSDKLGQRGDHIVASLRGEKDHAAEPDLLSRWIAHELAGAMHDADTAKSAKARREAVAHATDLILRLWEHRSDWPKGWPPPGAATAIAQLEDRPYGMEASGSVWADSAMELDSLARQEFRLWWQLELLQRGVEPQRAAVAAVSDKELREDTDFKLLDQEVRLHDALTAWFQNEGADSADARLESVRAAFKTLAARRRALLRRTLAAAAKAGQLP